MVLVQDFTEDKLQEWLAGFGALEEAWIQKDVCVKILNASFRILQPAAAKPVATTTTGATRENHQIAARMLIHSRVASLQVFLLRDAAAWHSRFLVSGDPETMKNLRS